MTLNGVGWILSQISAVTEKVDDKIQELLGAACQDPEFRAVEANWRSLADLAASVDQDDVIVDFINVTKDELAEDLKENQTDIFGSALFRKVYVDEYDRYGGKPFSAMIGLYEFENTKDDDLVWLETMAKIANAAHCPFVSAVSPKFFQPCRTIEEVAQISDLETMMMHPRFAAWQALRDQPWAAYLGLTLPRYLIRKPWGADLMLLDAKETGNTIQFKEKVNIAASDKSDQFLWGNAAVLFGKNLIRSYQNSGWAQHIRGPVGGGIVEGLPVFVYRNSDYAWEAKALERERRKKSGSAAGSAAASGDEEREEMQSPLEIDIPDYREFQFSKSGFIPLVHKKGEATATFFGAQAIKRPKDFVEELATQNAYLVTNLAYTFSITRIAHYVKRMMREYIGSTADNIYIQRVLTNWLNQYVTTVVNPDNHTLLYYPFKAVSVTVEPKPGPLGFYQAIISILPHIQFEGMDVELRLEAALGGAG
jgi:type VI secretion system protein ImpC